MKRVQAIDLAKRAAPDRACETTQFPLPILSVVSESATHILYTE